MNYIIHYNNMNFEFETRNDIRKWFDMNKKYAHNPRKFFLDVVGTNGELVVRYEEMVAGFEFDEDILFYTNLMISLLFSLKVIENLFGDIYDPDRKYLDLSEYSNISIDKYGEAKIIIEEGD